MEPLISVVIPVYNAGEYLRRCLSSVCGQSYQNWEIILIDDGSTDGSGSICDEFAGEDGRIRAIHQKNAGVSASRNRGIDLAKGDHITFLDSDDWIEANLYQRLADEIRDQDPDIIQWAYEVDDADGHCIYKKRYRVKTLEACDCNQIFEYFAPIGYVWNKIYKMQVIDSLSARFEEGVSLYEDMLFNLFLLSNNRTILLHDHVGTHYMQYPASLGRKGKASYYSTAIRCLDQKLSLLENHDISEVEKKKFRDRECVNISYNALKANSPAPPSASTVNGVAVRLKDVSVFRLNKKALLKYILLELMLMHPKFN